MRPLYLLLLLLVSPYCDAQQYTLQNCIDTALQNNVAVRIARQSVQTRQYEYDASRLNILPKADFLGGYNHLGKPLTIDLQQVKDGVVQGSSRQSVSAANSVYNEITGNNLPQSTQDRIYNTSSQIIGDLYPNYNPQLSKQDYFTAGIIVREPVYMGGKLRSVRRLAAQQVSSGKVNLDIVQDNITYNISLQYLQLLYLNSMLDKQQSLVNALKYTLRSADNLLKAEIIPPYQKKWADVALAQGTVNYSNLKLEKENALLQLKELTGIDLDKDIAIDDTLSDNASLPATFFTDGLEHNADIRLLDSKTKEAEIMIKTTRQGNLPNVFAIGNYQFLQKNLPLTMPPWLIGIELQWSLTDWMQNDKRIKAAQSLKTETTLLKQQKQSLLSASTRIAQNKIIAMRNQMLVLKMARDEAAATTAIVQTRLENSMASIKDVNDAQQVLYEAEKAYFTSVLTFKVALATYLYIQGTPASMTNYLK